MCIPWSWRSVLGFVCVWHNKWFEKRCTQFYCEWLKLSVHCLLWIWMFKVITKVNCFMIWNEKQHQKNKTKKPNKTKQNKQTHVECSSVFPSQYIFFEPCEVPTVFFLLSISLTRAVFSVVNLRNVFQPIASGVNTDASTWLLSSGLFCTYSQTWDRVVNFSQSNPMRGLREARTKLRKPSFACHNLAYKPPRNARTRATLGHFQTVRLRTNSW